jgi:glutathione reductase (NADPH)
MTAFDVVIIGAGTAGQTAAYDLAAAGLNVAVVEASHRPGGTCALSGCQPKKWFYEAAETIARCRHLAGKGVVGVPTGAWSQVLAEKNRFTARVPERTVRGFKDEGIVFWQGQARFKDAQTIQIDDQPVRGRFFILATGARPMALTFKGAENLTTSDAFLELTELPERIVFVGGGFIAFEFAHFAARLGPENGRSVILEAAARPLGPFDAQMVEGLVDASKQVGIEVHTGVAITAIEKHAGGFYVHTEPQLVHEADLVVHGAGRSANIAALALEAAGIDFSRRGVTVDARMQTSNPRVFAVGDCAASIQLARVADFEAHVAATNILAAMGKADATTIDYQAVPAVLFTYPQYAMVGRTESDLQAQGVGYRKSAEKNLKWPTYQRIGLRHAAYKILVGADGRFLGAHFLADNACGLVNTIRQAMLNGTTAAQLHRQSIMTPYPSRESDLIYMLEPFLPAAQ